MAQIHLRGQISNSKQMRAQGSRAPGKEGAEADREDKITSNNLYEQRLRPRTPNQSANHTLGSAAILFIVTSLHQSDVMSCKDAMVQNDALQPDDLVAMIPALRAFARSFYRDKENAEDLVQETLLKALANRQRYIPFSPLKSWLFTIMRNTFCTNYRMQQREIPGRGEYFIATVDASQEVVMETKDVEIALQSLPAKYRNVLSLVVLEGKSYELTAQLCGCSIGTVKSRLHRARRKLSILIEGA
ncbi:sigma-70 family RNA polymerase sigma factor [Falsochrobactrum shanghaiense]